MSVTPGNTSASEPGPFREHEHVLTICSDSLGETAEAVASATLRQFDGKKVRLRRVAYVRTQHDILQVLIEAKHLGSFVAYTIVQPELRETLKSEAIRLGVRVVDIMGPMLQAFADTFDDAQARDRGSFHELDDHYFKRVEAVEFAVKYDDGRDPSGLALAQVVLIGVSRTSKTPLSMFLAYKGYKVANWPLVPEVRLPGELLALPPERVFGLTMDAETIHRIRTERLKVVGLPEGSKYASLERIHEELEYAADVMRQIGCRTVEVTDKAIEDIAGTIIGYMA